MYNNNQALVTITTHRVLRKEVIILYTQAMFDAHKAYGGHQMLIQQAYLPKPAVHKVMVRTAPAIDPWIDSTCKPIEFRARSPYGRRLQNYGRVPTGDAYRIMGTESLRKTPTELGARKTNSEPSFIGAVEV